MRSKMIIVLSICALVTGGLGLRAHLAQTTPNQVNDSSIDSIGDETKQSQSINTEKADTKRIESAANASDVNQTLQEKLASFADQNPEAQELNQRYQKQVISLATEIQKSGINIDELNEIAGDVSFEEFLKRIPKNLRPHYQDFHAVIQEMQAWHIKQDGMPKEFFNRYQVTPPAWIIERHQALKQVELPREVASLIEDKKNAQTLQDNDVEQILKGCGKGQRDCIERAFVSLIDANHALTDEQHKKIEQYL